jgi:hypothetical protein
MRAQSTLSAIMEDVLICVRKLADDAEWPLPLNFYGPKDDGANSAPPGIWWAPGRERWQHSGTRGGQAGEPGSLWVRYSPISVLLFGGENPPMQADAEDPARDAGTFLRETDATEALIELFVNACQQRLSQFSYEIEGGDWGESSRTGIGLAYDMTVTLRLPLVRIDNDVVILKGTTATTRLPNE